jgi:hypothetical protein
MQKSGKRTVPFLESVVFEVTISFVPEEHNKGDFERIISDLLDTADGTWSASVKVVK